LWLVADSHEREKLLLLDEVDQLKREKELLERSVINKDAEMLDLHNQVETGSAATRTSDNRVRLLESQVISTHSPM